MADEDARRPAGDHDAAAVAGATADPAPSDPAPAPTSTLAAVAGSVPRGVVILLGAAAAVIAVAGMFASSWLIGPLLLALIIVIAVTPIQGWLKRKGWPAWAATLSLVVVIYGSLLVLTVFLVASVSQLGAVLAQNAGKSQQLVAQVTAALKKVGIDPTAASSTAKTADLSKLAAPIGDVLAGVGSLLSSLIFILALLLFLTAESGGTARRMAMIGGERPHMIAALDGFVHGTRNYLIVTAVFGFIVAVLDGVALAIMGIPLAVLWAVLAFLTNFIPNIGFIIGLVPPALLALLTGGWELALIVIVVYCVLNMVIQSLIQPRFIGDSVGLSATVTFLALLFWAWVLGPLGALLAIPVTLLVKAVLVDSDPRARWVEALLGSEPSVPKEKRADKRARKHVGNGHVPTVEGALTPPRA